MGETFHLLGVQPADLCLVRAVNEVLERVVAKRLGNEKACAETPVLPAAHERESEQLFEGIDCLRPGLER